MDFDRVVIMDSGRVVEIDSPEILMANDESLLLEGKGSSREKLVWCRERPHRE